MKNGVLVLAILVSLFFINLVGAQFFGGGYGGFSLNNLFSTIDPATFVYILIFLIILTVVNLAIRRTSLFTEKSGEPNRVAAGVVSFSVAALIVYYIYQSGYDVSSVLYNLGFAGNLQSLLVIIIAVILAIFVIIKFKWPGFFIISGLLLMGISVFTQLIYEQGTAFALGFILVFIGLFVGKKMHEKKLKREARISNIRMVK